MQPLDPELEAEAWRLQREGLAAANAGRPAEAGVLLRNGLALLGWSDQAADVQPEAAPVAARLLISLAFTEAALGDSARGFELLTHAEEWVDERDMGILLHQRAFILRMCGRKSEALEVFAAAEPLLKTHGHTAILVRLHLNRSAVFSADGQFAKALSDLRTCLTLANEQGLSLDAAKALHTRAIVERLIGDVPGAMASLGEAERLYRQHAPGMVGMVLAQLANLLQDVGLLHDALVRLDRAIESMRRLQHNHTLARAETHRSMLTLELGDVESALALAHQAQEWAEKQGDLGIAGWAELVRRQAEYELGGYGPAFTEECLRLADRLNEFGADGNAELAGLLAVRSLVGRGDHDSAESLLRGVRRKRHSEQFAVRLTRRLVYTELEMARGDRKAALFHARRGLAALHDYRSRLGSVEFQVSASALGRELAEMGLSIALDSMRPSTVFSWSERVRAQAYRLPSVTPPEDSVVADHLAQLRKLRNEIRESERAGEPTADLIARCRRLERELRERSWREGGPGESVPSTRIAALHTRLRDTASALISFLSHRDDLHAMVLAGGKIAHLKLGPISAIDEGVRRLFADLDGLQGRRMPPRMADAIRNSIHHQTEQLSAALLTEVMPLVGDRDLVIVPTQLLSSLPWGLLPPLRGRPVTVAPSASVWMAAGTREHKNGGKPLLVAGPDLALAESELAEIALHYPQGTVLRGEHATAAATLSALDGAPIAHLAAHGHHEPDNVLFSRLDFADGPLMAYDIARLAAPPRHVTLSACDVGRSVVAVGDETLGFTAALLYAGTSTVVSSVARVAHDVAAQVMVDYHEAIAAGVAPARALAEANAQHELAPFVLFGAG